MKLLTIIKKIYYFLERDDEKGMLDWFRKNIQNHPDNLDLSYWDQEALASYSHDAEWIQREPLILNQCTEVLKNKSDNTEFDVAKAYAYRGEMRYYKIDRVKDFDKAIKLLKKMDTKDPEVKFITRFIEDIYNHHIRKIFQFYTTSRDMFIIN